MDVSLLSNGAIKACIEGHGPPKPRLQILSIKKLQGGDNSNVDRFRLQLSDGIHHQPGMLATQLNEKIHKGEIDKFSVVQVEKMVTNTIQNRKIMIIINLTVLHQGTEVGGMLGSPTNLDISTENGSSTGHAPPTKMQTPGGNMARPPLAQNPSMSRPQSTFGAPQGRPAPVQQSPPPRQFYGGQSSDYAAQHSSPMQHSGTQLSTKMVLPITSLNPYQNKWTIKARVTSKPSLRNYSNSRGEGRVMSVELVDHSGEIKATGFNEAADKLYPMFEANKVYYISRGRIKPANKQYTTCKNEYEMMFTADTQVEECLDGATDLPTASFDFTAIGDLEQAPKDSIIDVIGICTASPDVTSVITRTTNKKLSKRDITILGKSGKSVTCTLWGTEAEGFDGSNYPVVAIKGVRVSDFNGVSLSSLGSSTLHINPDISEAHQLKGWYDHYGKTQQVTSLSSQMSSGGPSQTAFLTIKQTKELDLGRRDKPDFFSCKACVIFVRKENCLYKACPSSECNKKVTDDNTGRYFCEKCGQNYPNFQYRFILKVNCSDFSDNFYLDCFNDIGAILIGMDAQALGELRDEDEARFEQVIDEAYFKEYIFRVRAKIDTYNDEQRLRCSCVSAQPVNYAQETRRRLEQIKELMVKP